MQTNALTHERSNLDTLPCLQRSLDELKEKFCLADFGHA